MNVFINVLLLSTIQTCFHVQLPPSSRVQQRLSRRCDQMSRARRRVCVLLLFSECFHRVGGCVGGGGRGGVSSEVGIPEQKNTQQKQGLPLFSAVTRAHAGVRAALIGFIDPRDGAVSSASVCCAVHARQSINQQCRFFFLFLYFFFLSFFTFLASSRLSSSFVLFLKKKRTKSMFACTCY